MIEEYNFGLITIDGENYDYDVEVRWSGEVLKWWRKESHQIDVEDVKRAVAETPDTIIIGTGESGVAKVTEEAKKFIQEKGIKLIIDRTEEATRTFNIVNEDSEEEEGEQDKSNWPISSDLLNQLGAPFYQIPFHFELPV